jgi:hypothetical protein
MAENINRKKFLRLSLLAPLGWMISESAAKAIAVFSKGPVNNQHVAFYKSGDPLYESLRKGFNKRIDKLPAVIALCQDTTRCFRSCKICNRQQFACGCKKWRALYGRFFIKQQRNGYQFIRHEKNRMAFF